MVPFERRQASSKNDRGIETEKNDAGASASLDHTPRILLLGDSNTDWDRPKGIEETWDAEAELSPIGYAGQLQNKEDKAGQRKYSVINRGFAGAGAKELADRIETETDIEQTLIRSADVIVVAVGINDARHWEGIEEFPKHYRRILDLLKKNNSHAELITCVPCFLNNKSPELSELLEKVSAGIVGESESIGTHLVDLRGSLAGAVLDDYLKPDLDDGVHPSKKGHTIIAERIGEVLDDLF